MGQVFVANPSSVKVTWQVNGGALPVGWPGKVGGPPTFVSATLQKLPKTGCFNLGDNTLNAQFTDQEGGFTYPLAIPTSGISVDANLILYVFRGYAVLLSQFGYVISTAGVPVPPPPDPGLQAAG